jgi:hypothetical protein
MSGRPFLQNNASQVKDELEEAERDATILYLGGDRAAIPADSCKRVCESTRLNDFLMSVLLSDFLLSQAFSFNTRPLRPPLCQPPVTALSSLILIPDCPPNSI